MRIDVFSFMTRSCWGSKVVSGEGARYRMLFYCFIFTFFSWQDQPLASKPVLSVLVGALEGFTVVDSMARLEILGPVMKMSSVVGCGVRLVEPV